MSFAWRARVAVEVRYGWLCVVGVSGANAPVNAQPHQKIAAMLGRPGHSTPSLCSPTRAAIITGRNHHSVGFGVVGEIATGFPGYNSIIPIEKGTVGTILKDNGYCDRVVRQGPQHALVPVEPGRAVRSMAERNGL